MAEDVGIRAEIAKARRDHKPLLITADYLEALLDRAAHAERVLATTWEHRCSDRVGGCTAISTSALDAYRCEYPEAHD